MIPPLYTHAAAAAVAAALAFGVAWQWQANKYGAQLSDLKAGHASTLQQLADKTRAAYDAVRAREGQIQALLANMDGKHQQELAHAKTETDRLRACVRNRTCGVRIIAAAPSAHACPRAQDAAAGGVGDGAVELDAEAAGRVLDLRESVHADAAKLDYLQGYAQACYRAGIEASGVSGD